eukprot:gene6915-8041_t
MQIWGCGNGGGAGNSTIPVQTNAFDQVQMPLRSIACAGDATFLVDANGQLMVIGRGYLGSDKESSANQPTVLAALSGGRFKAVYANTHQNKNFTFALADNGALFSLGNSCDFRTGLGTEIDVLVPRLVDGFDAPVVQVAVGVGHVIAITAPGTIYTWGRPFGYKGAPIPTPSVLAAKFDSQLIQVVAGDGFTLFLTKSGLLYGVGDAEASSCLAEVDGTKGIVQVPFPFGRITQLSAGHTHVAALTEDGVVVTWGANKNGALGIGEPSYDRMSINPVRNNHLPKCIYVHSTFFSSFAITEAGDVYAWGYNVRGSLGTKHTRNLTEPEQVPLLSPANTNQVIVEMTLCENYTLFLMDNDNGGRPPQAMGCVDEPVSGAGTYPELPAWLADSEFSGKQAWVTGSLYGTGNDADEQMTMFRDTKSLASKGTPTSVAVGNKCSYATFDDGSIYTWGSGYALGQGVEGACKEPSRIWDLDAVKVVSVVAGMTDVAFALTDRGSLYAWGRAAHHVHGTGQDYDAIHPRLLEGFRVPITKIVCSPTHTLALDNSGAIYAWGSGKALGNRNRSSLEKSPKKIQDQTFAAIDIAAAANVSIMLSDSGHILTWGEGLMGQLGLGSNKFASLPTVIKEMPEKYVAVACGPDYCTAIGVSGSMWMWGSRASGLLDVIPGLSGDSVDLPRKVPIQVGHVAKVVPTALSCFTINREGGLFAWGEPHMGVGTGMPIRTPTRVASTQGVAVQNVCASDWQCMALVANRSQGGPIPPGIATPIKEAASIISPPSTPASLLSSELLGRSSSGGADSIAPMVSSEDIEAHEAYIKSRTDEIRFWTRVDADADIATWCGRVAEIKEFLARPDAHTYPPNVLQSLVHAQKIIPTGERVIKGWVMFSINFKDYESTRIILVTTEAIHRIKYDFTNLAVIHDKIFALNTVYKAKIGRFATWNSTVSNGLRSKVYEKQVGIQIWFENPSNWKPPSFVQPWKKVKAPYITLRPALNLANASIEEQEMICAEIGTAIQVAIHAKRNKGQPITLLNKFANDSQPNAPAFPVRKVDSLQRFSGNGLLSFVNNKYLAKTQNGFVDPASSTTTTTTTTSNSHRK